MARFIAVSPGAGAPPNGQYQKFRKGQTFADTSGNALAGDIVFPTLCATPPPWLAPLDSAAQALQANSTITTLSQIASGTTYANGYGVSADAGD
jgi:hypothetical protein